MHLKFNDEIMFQEEERSSSRPLTNNPLQVKGVPMSGTESLSSPFQRNNALPPLDNVAVSSTTITSGSISFIIKLFFNNMVISYILMVSI